MSTITSYFLKKMRHKALRQRVWYEALDKIERGIVDLTIKCVEQVRSYTLAKSIFDILKKIRDAQKSVFIKRHKDFGLTRAIEIVSIAVKIGSNCAEGWLKDDNLSLWLALHDLYKP